MRLSLANLGAATVACLTAGLIAVIAVTGRWPVDAPRTHLDKAGILWLPVEQVAQVEIVSGGQHIRLFRQPRGGWRVGDSPAPIAVAEHVAAALRILAVSAPRRVLAADEYSAGQLVVFGLDPPRFEVVLVGADGNVAVFGFGTATPAQNAQYVRVAGRPELYLLPSDVGDEWELARDMAARPAGRLLPVSVARIWAIEIVSGGVLRRFERDGAGLWFHHYGQHVHVPGGFVHHADPKAAPLIAVELDALDRMPIGAPATTHPDAAALAAAGLVHPATIVLLYSRYSAGPIARVEFGDAAPGGSGRWVRLRHSDRLFTVPPGSEKPLATLFRLAGAS